MITNKRPDDSLKTRTGEGGKPMGASTLATDTPLLGRNRSNWEQKRTVITIFDKNHWDKKKFPSLCACRLLCVERILDMMRIDEHHSGISSDPVG